MPGSQIFPVFLFLALFCSFSVCFAEGQATGGKQLNTGGIQTRPTNTIGHGSSSPKGNSSLLNVGIAIQPGLGAATNSPDVTSNSSYVMPPYLSHLRDQLTGHAVSNIELIGTLTPQTLVSTGKYHVSLMTSALSFITLTPSLLQSGPVDTTCIQIPPGWASNRINIRLRNNFAEDGHSSFYLLEVLLSNKCVTSGDKLRLERRDNTGTLAIDDEVWLTQIQGQHYLFSDPLPLDEYAAGTTVNKLTFHLTNRPEKERLASFGYIHTRLYRIYTDASLDNGNSIEVDRDSVTETSPEPALSQSEQVTTADSSANNTPDITQGGQVSTTDSTTNTPDLTQAGLLTMTGDDNSEPPPLTQGGQTTVNSTSSDASREISQGNQTNSHSGKIIRGGSSFAKITGITGRSKDPKHRGWHEVQRWWMDSKTGQLIIVKKQDRSTYTIKRWFNNRSHVSAIVLETRPDGRRHEIKGIRLTGYEITSAGNQQLETLTFSKIQRRK